MAKLTEQEQQEIIRYIEANKPLPDKYRFLLFEEKREVELVWNGKTSEVCNIVLPFQVIEQVDEPRAEKTEETTLQQTLFDLDERSRQLKGWTNKLIWGDNKLILSSLKNGPLREEIEAQGGLKLIYIDPPFDVGADFSMDIEIGGDTFTKKPNILEEIAYRDTWGKGADSFIAMIYERLVLMRDLLADGGSIFLHIGPNVSHYVNTVLDESLTKFSDDSDTSQKLYGNERLRISLQNASRLFMMRFTSTQSQTPFCSTRCPPNIQKNTRASSTNMKTRKGVTDSAIHPDKARDRRVIFMDN
jgi:hypothetical protein